MPSWNECAHGSASPTSCLVCRQELLRQKYTWKKVRAPRAWHPRDPGEELIGFYGGKTTRTGSYGQYEVALVHTVGGAFMVSGVRIIQLVDAGGFLIGAPIRIIYQGQQPLDGDKKMKLVEVYSAEGETIAESDLPPIRVAQ